MSVLGMHGVRGAWRSAVYGKDQVNLSFSTSPSQPQSYLNIAVALWGAVPKGDGQLYKVQVRRGQVIWWSAAALQGLTLSFALNCLEQLRAAMPSAS